MGLLCAGAVTDPEQRAAGRMDRLLQWSLGWGVPRFGLPLAVGMLLHTAFNLADMVMVGQLPEATAALGALGICDMLAALVTIVAQGLSTGSVAIVSRRAGGDDVEGAREAAGQSLVLVGALSVLSLLLALLGAGWLVRDVMQAKGEVAGLATAYLRVMLGGGFSMFFLLQVTALLRAVGHAKSAAALLVGGNVLNILLNVLFIYGPGPLPDPLAGFGPVAAALGIPRMGVVGAAWATVIGRTVAVLVGAWLLWRRLGLRLHAARTWVPRWNELRILMRLGGPTSAQLVLRVGAVLVLLSLVAGNYTTEQDPSVLAALGICLRLETAALFVGLGWGAAASSFVGANLGAGRPRRAWRAGWVAAGYAAATGALLAFLYVRYSSPLIALFDDTPSVVAAGRAYLETVALTYVFAGLGAALSQAIAGAGATLESLVVDAVVLLGLVVPGAIVVVETLQQPPEVLWRFVAVGNVVAGLAFALDYGRGAFLRKRI